MQLSAEKLVTGTEHRLVSSYAKLLLNLHKHSICVSMFVVLRIRVRRLGKELLTWKARRQSFGEEFQH